MQKFFKSGNAFFLVGVLCLLAGFFSKQSVVFISLGAFWIIIGIIMRMRTSKKDGTKDVSSDSTPPTNP